MQKFSDRERHCLRLLTKHSPTFKVDPDKCHFLRTPTEFHNDLKRAALEAKSSIILSSLYISNDSYCQELINCLHDACGRNEELKVVLLFDYLRSLREPVKNSFSLLLPLLENYPTQVRIYFYHTPKLNGIKKELLPNRVNEIVGVQHTKLYMFDDNLLISGANLSETYFTLRQDRYLWIKNNSEIVNYFTNLVKTICNLSFNVTSKGELEYSNNNKYHPIKQSSKYAKHACDLIKPFIIPNNNSDEIEFDSHSTWCFPLLQMAPFKTYQDEETVSELLKSISNCKTDILSPYLNLAPKYKELIMKSDAKLIRVFTASPEANGFYTAKDFSKYVPTAYSAVELLFYNKINKLQLQDRITIHEWKVDGWTYHGKGVYVYFPNEELPSLVIIGSTNLGVRSAEKDLEAQIAIVTNNNNLKLKIKEEFDYLTKPTKQINKETFDTPNRKIPFWMNIAVNFVGDFL